MIFVVITYGTHSIQRLKINFSCNKILEKFSYYCLCYNKRILGINMDVVCQMANDVHCSDVRVRDKVLINLVNYVESTLLHLQQNRDSKYSNYGEYSKMTLWYRCRKRVPPCAYLFTKLL